MDIKYDEILLSNRDNEVPCWDTTTCLPNDLKKMTAPSVAKDVSQLEPSNCSKMGSIHQSENYLWLNSFFPR